MICTELGLTFEREDSHWRCKEHPELLMFPDGRYGIAGPADGIIMQGGNNDIRN